MVKNLRGELLRRIEGLFRRVFFRNDFTAYVVGALATILVQSSSVTTAMGVPMETSWDNRPEPDVLPPNLAVLVEMLRRMRNLPNSRAGCSF